jgi:hypothetical protein
MSARSLPLIVVDLNIGDVHGVAGVRAVAAQVEIENNI